MMLRTTMIQYTPITKEINNFKGNSKLSDAYRYACLFSTRDYKTGISKYNQETISKKFNIPESTLINSIKRLSEQNNILQIEQKWYHKNNSFIRKNYYYMNNNPENYFFIDNDFFTLDIDINIKGFVLLLKAICYNNTNTYVTERQMKGSINKSEIARKLNLDRGTFDKYLNLAKENDLIDILDKKLIIINESFLLTISKEKRHSEIVNTIQEICNKYKAAMPIMDKKDIDRLYMYYYTSESEIEIINNSRYTECCSLKYILENRIKNLPKDFSIEYIFKILNIPKPLIKERISFENIKMT